MEDKIIKLKGIFKIHWKGFFSIYQTIEEMSFHKFISFIKSGLRIIGFITLMFHVALGALILILAEVLGILEEL